MAIRIITDSVSDLPEAILKQYKIEVLPLMVNFEDGSYRDGIDLTSESFFLKLKEAKKLPTTSQVNPGEFISSFEKVIAEGDEAIVILMSSKMSGTFSAANTAVEYLGTDQISVVDSKAISFGYGLLVVEAARLVESGRSRLDIVKCIESAADRLVNLFIVDTLEYLQKGGRLSASEAMIGNLLNIKPIITIDDGKLKSMDKVRGRKKAYKWLVDYLNQQPYDISTLTVGFYHAEEEEDLKEMVDIVCSQVGRPREILYSHVGTVVGTHSGPGCLAMSYIKPE